MNARSAAVERGEVANLQVSVIVDGVEERCPADVTVAAALLNLGRWCFRRSVSGQARGPLCGMGTCHECLVTIDGVPNRRACMTWIRPEMEVRTDG